MAVFGKERPGGWWATIRWIWVRVGLLAGVVFVGWSLLAYRATGVARAALTSDARVEVTDRQDHWVFAPRGHTADAGLIFYAGALVDPVAYAPLARAVAERGYPVLLVQLPRRAAFGGADGAAPLTRAINATLGLRTSGTGSWPGTPAAGKSRQPSRVPTRARSRAWC